MTRQIATEPKTWHVETTGQDTPDMNGDPCHPFRTPGYAWQRLCNDWDLNYIQGHKIKCGPTSAGHNFTNGFNGSGQPIGQADFFGLTFEGNPDVAPSLMPKIKPSPGYAFGPLGGRYCISGFHIDGKFAQADLISPSHGGIVAITGPMKFGRPAGIGFNYLSTSFQGQIGVFNLNSNAGPLVIEIDNSEGLVHTTGTWTAPQTGPDGDVITLADASQIEYGMAVFGPGIHRSSWVTGKDGNTIRLNGRACFEAGTGEPLVFAMACQSFIDAGIGGICCFNTNGSPNLIKVVVKGLLFCYAGFALSNGAGANISLQTIDFDVSNAIACMGPKFVAEKQGVIDVLATTNDPKNYLPGDYVEIPGVSFAAGVDVITLPANPSIPCTGTTVAAGMYVMGPGIRSSADPEFDALSEPTSVIGIDGPDNCTIYLSRKTKSAQENVTLYFPGFMSQGGFFG